MKPFDIEPFLEGETPNGWQCRYLSIHAKWLSQDEAAKHWMSFAALSSGAYDPNWLDFIAVEQRFINLFTALESQLGLSICRQNINRFGLVEAAKNMEETIRLNVRELRFDAFVSQTSDVLILGNFDLTFPMYTQDTSRCGIQSRSLCSV
ncbi:hypothetical protein [Motilimonas sp. KMU-193]|uniref:hypothetical protein n=1 Tax=Motilimonas sp. KMU-193 TaxID=3388668 RepID=UPI00396AFE6A